MASGIRILSQKEATNFLAGGTTTKVITTTFMVDNDGPFTVSQEEAGFNAGQQQTLILAKAESVRAARQHPSFS
jgi:hypothetical protein